jgi:hypothetical protein
MEVVAKPNPAAVEELSWEIVQTLRHRHAGGGPNPRRAVRHPWRLWLEIQLQSSPVNGGMLRTETVETTDISAGGFGFYCDRFVYPGTRVYVTLPLKQRCVVEGEVRYSVHQTGLRHRVGVEFLQTIRLGEP